jgi:CO/xanthine dehydrogenase FAD-binding subunit
MADLNGELNLTDTEVLTRIRIPLSNWNFQYHRTLAPGPRPNDLSLSFCGLANTIRGVLTDFRFAFGSMGTTLIRNREIEAELVSRKVPLPPRECDSLCETFDGFIELSFQGSISTYQANMASKMFRWFITSLGE